MAQRKPQSDNAMMLLNFRVGVDRVDRFREIAAANERTVSQELRFLMEQRIAAAEADELGQAA